MRCLPDARADVGNPRLSQLAQRFPGDITHYPRSATAHTLDSKIAAPAARAVAPNMVVEESADAVVAAASTVGMMVAASASDFGGYTIPIIGLGLIGATIALLAGPVED